MRSAREFEVEREHSRVEFQDKKKGEEEKRECAVENKGDEMEEGFGKSEVRMQGRREDVKKNRDYRSQDEKKKPKRKLSFNFRSFVNILLMRGRMSGENN